MAKAKKINVMSLEEILIPMEEQPYDVPQNWCWTNISGVAELYTGNSINERVKKEKYLNQPEGLNFIATKDVEFDNSIVYDNGVKINDYDKFKTAPANTSLLCIEGGSAGRKLGFTREKVCFGNKLCAFVDKVCVPKYIYYYLQSNVFYNQFMNQRHGLIGGVSVKELSNIAIPVATLAEQQRIVEQIESLFAKLDEAKEKAQDIVDKFGDVERAILYDAFTGKLTKKWRIKNCISENSWIESTLQEVCCMKITDGTHKTPTYCEKEDGGVPFISAKDVTTKKICWDNIKYIVPELHEELYARLAPQMDDVLLAKNGTTGVAAIVDVDKVFDLYVTLAVLRPNKNVINPRYLLNIINSPICKNQFDEHLTGIGVPNLHLRDIKNVKISLPELDEQEEVIRIVDNLLEKETRAFELAKHTVESIDIMKKTVLAKAFRGELGTNNPDEENVLELLKQVLA